MRLRILHTTSAQYMPSATYAQQLAVLRPVQTLCQIVVQHALHLQPAPSSRAEFQDAFGNWLSAFSIESPHGSLRVEASSEVVTQAPSELSSQIDLASLSSAFAGRDLMVCGSQHAPVSELFRSYAQPSFTVGQSAAKSAIDLMSRIHTEFDYSSGTTTIYTPPEEALASRQGVCQDFAHILVACLRSMGLAARYVSGYLLTEPPEGQPRLVGADASHAWASLALEDGTWLDLDPTNNRWGVETPGEDYVRLAVGRDFADVSPLRGVIQGSGQHQLMVGVTVEAL